MLLSKDKRGKIQKKRLILFIAIVLLTSVPCSADNTPHLEGSSRSIEHYTFNEGTEWMFGTTNDVSRASIGDAVIGIVFSSNPAPPQYGFFQGFLFVELFIPPLPDWQYDIDFVLAEEYEGGAPINQSAWQNDSDPFFYWQMKAPDIEILGYSVSFNEYPDEFVDTEDANYQTPDLYLADGKHVFYVVAKNTSGNFGQPGSFDVWVDTVRPTITNMLPENGTVTNEVRPTIQAVLFDATSGIDPASIEFTVTTAFDEFNGPGVYDPGTGLVVFTPPADIEDGIVTVQLEARDFANNAAIPQFWTFTVDTTEPTGSISINNNAPTTDSPTVNLNLFAATMLAEVTHMMISNDGVFDDEQWEPYVTVKENWELPLIAGIQTVYVKYRDAAMNESDIFFDSIVLILAVPNTFVTAGPQSVTAETSATFEFTASIENSKFQYKLDAAAWSAWVEEGSIEFNDLTTGNHYFQVRAGIDLDNNGTIDDDEIDASPAVVSWTVGDLTTIPQETKQPIRYYQQQ